MTPGYAEVSEWYLHPVVARHDSAEAISKIAEHIFQLFATTKRESLRMTRYEGLRMTNGGC
jgi:hypothetical protein